MLNDLVEFPRMTGAVVNELWMTERKCVALGPKGLRLGIETGRPVPFQHVIKPWVMQGSIA